MIDKNTIMLDNIVGRQFYNPNPQDPKTMIEPCVVCSIGETYCNVSHFDKKRLKVKYEFLEPIKLTRDWFLKLGFIPMLETSEYSGCFSKKGFMLKPYINDDGEQTEAFYHVDMFKEKIEYVHQLQNLYFTWWGIHLNKLY